MLRADKPTYPAARSAESGSRNRRIPARLPPRPCRAAAAAQQAPATRQAPPQGVQDAPTWRVYNVKIPAESDAGKVDAACQALCRPVRRRPAQQPADARRARGRTTLRPARRSLRRCAGSCAWRRRRRTASSRSCARALTRGACAASAAAAGTTCWTCRGPRWPPRARAASWRRWAASWRGAGPLGLAFAAAGRAVFGAAAERPVSLSALAARQAGAGGRRRRAAALRSARRRPWPARAPQRRAPRPGRRRGQVRRRGPLERPPLRVRAARVGVPRPACASACRARGLTPPPVAPQRPGRPVRGAAAGGGGRARGAAGARRAGRAARACDRRYGRARCPAQPRLQLLLRRALRPAPGRPFQCPRRPHPPAAPPHALQPQRVAPGPCCARAAHLGLGCRVQAVLGYVGGEQAGARAQQARPRAQARAARAPGPTAS